MYFRTRVGQYIFSKGWWFEDPCYNLTSNKPFTERKLSQTGKMEEGLCLLLRNYMLTRQDFLPANRDFWSARTSLLELLETKHESEPQRHSGRMVLRSARAHSTCQKTSARTPSSCSLTQSQIVISPLLALSFLGSPAWNLRA